MQSVKQQTIEIVAELIPELCPEEQEVFELYSNTFYEQAINQEHNNKMGDESYFGEMLQPICIFLLGTVCTVIIEEPLKPKVRLGWKKLAACYSKHIKEHPVKEENKDLVKALEKALKQKAEAEEKISQISDTIDEMAEKIKANNH